MPGDYSEDTLIEQPIIDLFSDLHWKTTNGFDEFYRGTYYSVKDGFQLQGSRNKRSKWLRAP